MPTEYSILRSKMLSLLPGAREFSLPAINLAFKGHGIELDENDLITVEQIIHEFYFEGILVPGVKPDPDATYQGGTLVFPRYHLTEYGKKVVSTTEYQPHDPDGYLARIRADIPKIDDVIIRYLEESLSCYRKNLLLAAAVMLGCAAEKAVLLLVQAYGNSISNGGEQQKYQNETKSFIIRQKWNALWKRLEPEAGSLHGQLGEDTVP